MQAVLVLHFSPDCIIFRQTEVCLRSVISLNVCPVWHVQGAIRQQQTKRCIKLRQESRLTSSSGFNRICKCLHVLRATDVGQAACFMVFLNIPTSCVLSQVPRHICLYRLPDDATSAKIIQLHPAATRAMIRI